MSGILRKNKAEPVAFTGNLLKLACDGFDSGRLSHDSFESLSEQLHAEGRRRVDSLVFEHGFEKRLVKVCHAYDLSVSLGWYLSHDRVKGVRYWIKLGRSFADWNDADIAMAERLAARSPGDEVILAIFDGARNIFLGILRMESGWSNCEDMRSLIKKETGRDPREIRRMDAATPEQIAPAVAYIARFGRHSRRAISIRRRFVNGVLSPCFHADPTDLDALVLAEDGNLSCVEFKRKYPARGDEKYFGLDEIPHVATMRIMTSLDIRTLHILLVAPLWSDKESPIDWLYQLDLADKWTWVVGWIDEAALVKDVELTTRGGKSGHRFGSRFQRAIDWRRLYELNHGLQLSDVASNSLAMMLSWRCPDLNEASYKALLSKTIQSGQLGSTARR